MKPLYILGLGSVSVILAIAKIFVPTIPWAIVELPLAAPMAYAFVAFVGVMIHALAMGNLEIVQKPAEPTAARKADSARQTK